MVTKEQKQAAISALLGLAECIRDLKRIPSGHLYARVMGYMDLDTWLVGLGFTFPNAKEQHYDYVS